MSGIRYNRAIFIVEYCEFPESLPREGRNSLIDVNEVHLRQYRDTVCRLASKERLCKLCVLFHRAENFQSCLVTVSFYEGESNENLKYFLSRNLLNTKGTQ